VYKHLKEKMKFLWDGGLKMNTVHIADVCSALWHSATTLPNGAVYNLCDKADTSQGSFNSILEIIFEIKTCFHGGMVSNLAKLKLKDVAEEANDKHCTPWSEMCKSAGILNTPLSPYIDPELLLHNHLHLDGTGIEGTGFKYQYPEPNLIALHASCTVMQASNKMQGGHGYCMAPRYSDCFC
jgi:hypothetical protein